MDCKYCNEKAVVKSYRNRNGQTNKENVCLDCHYLDNEQTNYKYNNIKKNKMNTHYHLDEIYSYIMTNYKESKCIKVLELIDELQNEIDNLNN